MFVLQCIFVGIPKDGEFAEDRRHGRGKFIWPDGAVYVRILVDSSCLV